MLPKPYRLPSDRIAEVLRKGKRVYREGLQLIIQKNHLNTPRLAVIVPVRLNKRATVRNRVKRLIREAVRKLLPTFPVGVDGVFMVRGRLPDRESEVEKTVQQLMALLR